MTASAWVYIATNKRRTVLYVGITNNLQARAWEHRTKSAPNSFTARYNVHIIVYYEPFLVITDAIAREKHIKGKSRKFKEELITRVNPEWRDLLADNVVM
jgi:putative endonuclease